MEYQTLTPGLRQIRLLELLPRPADDDIRCKMHIVSLDDDPTFEALSYTWGEEARDRPIWIDDCHRTHVSFNLKTALLRLRRNDSGGRLLWIDALCINQGDIQERNSQVLMMREIYAAAQDVVVWLGEWTPSLVAPRDFSEGAVSRAFASLGQVAQGVHLRDLPLFADPSRSDAEALTVIQYLLEHPYWRRIWVVQETVAARHVTVLCGGCQTDFNYFLKLDGLRGCWGDCCTPQWNSLPWNLQAAYFKFQPLVWSMRTTRDSFHGTGTLQMRLANLMVHFRHRQSTDPRDMVYALIGLVNEWPEGQSPLKIDYGLNTATVYTQAAFDALVGTKQLTLLVHCEHRGEVEGLPSWVPDWTSQGGNEQLDMSLKLLAPILFNASGSINVVPTLVTGSVLALSGHRVGVVTSAFHPATNPTETIRDWWIAADKQFSRNGDANSGSGSDNDIVGGNDSGCDSDGIPKLKPRWFFLDDNLEDCFMRTLLGDCIVPVGNSASPLPRRAGKEDIALFKHIMADLLSGQQPAPPAPAFDWQAAIPDEQSLWLSYSRTHTLDKRFFFVAAADSISKSEEEGKPLKMEGYMGIGPTKTCEGDEVWVLVGSPVPFVLRKVERFVDGMELCNAMELVGPCFVNGIMYGETEKWLNIEELFLT